MAEKKPSNRERIKEIVTGIEANIQDLFQSDKFADYLRTMSRFHNYSYNNTILIHMQMPNAARVAGFNKWKNQFGRHVKKGEKGLTVIAPTPFKKRVEEMKLDPDTRAPVLDNDGNVVMEEREIEIPLFRPVKVFDVSQTEGRPLSSLVSPLTGDVQQYEAFMEALRRTSPVPMQFKPLREGLDALVGEDNKIYLGRRDHYDNHGYYINDGNSLLCLSDNVKMFDFISGGGYYATQAELLAQGRFTMGDYAEFDALRVGVLAQFEQTEPLLFAGEPFSFIQPDTVELDQPAPSVPPPPEQADEALYLLDDSVYLHIQASDEGWDYTLYTWHDMALLDGGQLDDPGLSITDVVKHIQRTEKIGTLAVDLAPIEVLEELRDRADHALETAAEAAQPEQGRDYAGELREHFAQEDAALWDTPLDKYPLPDPAFPADELEQSYDYADGALLPLSRDRAEELLEQNLTVYMVEAGENPAMVFDRDDLMEQPEGTMFAVPCEEWEKTQDFRQAVADRMNHQEDRERAFLDHAGDCFAIYQVSREDPQNARFMSMDWLKSHGLSPERSNYELAYTASLPETPSVIVALNTLWEKFNLDHSADYQRPSMSVSDIVTIRRDGELSCHYCDSVGFAEIPDFISQKPTVAELEAQVQAGQTISLMDLADTVHREKKSVVAQLKSQPAQERKKTAPKKSVEKER